MSEQEAIATCEHCNTPLQQDYNLCPKCGTPTPFSSLGKGRGDTDSIAGRPVLSMMPDRPGVDLSLGPKRILSEGEKLGNQYRVLQTLGIGGFGEVYLVEDLTLNRKLALKVVEVAGNRTEIAQKQIVQEFAIREEISDNRHIIKGYSPVALQHKGLSLLLLPMELADGGSLRNWLSEVRGDDGRREEGLEFFKQACLGVKAIHEAQAGAVHLDIKPENILISNGIAKVSDFGIGRFYGSSFEDNPEQLVHQGMGTPQYMSPEQFRVNRQKDIGPTSDIYSLGVVLYEILDGHPPFDGTREELRDKHLTARPTPLRGAAEAWWPIVNRCLEREPAERYQNVSQLVRDLDRAARGVALTVDISCPECDHINENMVREDCEECGADVSCLFRRCPRCYKNNRLDVEACDSCGYAVAAHFLYEKRKKQTAKLKDEDPVAAIEILEFMLRDGAGDEEAELIRDLRRKLSELEGPIAQAVEAEAAGELKQAIEAWRDVLEIVARHRVALTQIAELETFLAEFEDSKAKALDLMDLAMFREAEKLLLDCVASLPLRQEVRSRLDSCRQRAKRYSAAFEQAREAHVCGLLMETARYIEQALAEATRSEDACTFQMDAARTMERNGELLTQAHERMRSAEFPEAERNVQQIEEVQSDLPGLDAFKDELTKTRTAYGQAMDGADHAVECGDLAEALVFLRNAMTICPDASMDRSEELQQDQERARVFIEDARAAIPAAEFDEATDRLRQAEELWPKFEELADAKEEMAEVKGRYLRHMDQARKAKDGKDLDGILAAVKQALKVCPKAKEPSSLKGAARKGQAKAKDLLESVAGFLPAARFDEASEALREAAEISSQYPAMKDAEVVLARTRKDHGDHMAEAERAKGHRNLEKALKEAEVALEVCPDSIEAKAFSDEIKKDQERARSIVANALALLTLADFAQAAAMLQQAGKLWLGLAALDEAKGTLEESRTTYQDCMKRAEEAMASRDIDVVLDAIEAALESCPESQDALNIMASTREDQAAALAHVDRARNQLECARFDAAHEQVEKARSVWRHREEYETLATEIESKQCDYEEAIQKARYARSHDELSKGQRFCSRALELCPSSVEAKNLDDEIRGQISSDRQKCDSERARKITIAKWAAIVAVGLVGLGVLLFSNPVFGGISIAASGLAAFLNWKLDSKLHKWFYFLAFIDDEEQAFAVLTDLLLLVSGGLGVLVGVTSISALGEIVGMGLLGVAYLLAPVLVCGAAFSEFDTAWKSIRATVGLLLIGGVLTGLVFGAIWLWGWATGYFWPWSKLHQWHLTCVAGGLIVLQTIIHKSRNTDTYIDAEFSKVFFVPILIVGGIVGICALLATFAFDSPWKTSGIAAGLLVSILFGLGAVLFACLDD